MKLLRAALVAGLLSVVVAPLVVVRAAAEDCAPLICQGLDVYDWMYWYFGCYNPPCP